MKLEAYCGFPFTRARVTSEGYLAFCCFMRGRFYDDQSKLDACLGNILDSSFDTLWFGEVAEAIRKETIEGEQHIKCRSDACPFTNLKRPLAVKEVEYDVYPTFLEIDLPNTHCNIGGLSPGPTSPACIMCERAHPEFRPERNRLFDVLDKVKHLVPTLNHLHIQGIAEPFLQTRANGFLLFEVLERLEFAAHAEHVQTSVTTNGTIFHKAVRSRYLSDVPNSVTTFSLDAATPETYKKIRILDCFDKVLENLAAFGAERDKKHQHLHIHNNINTVNVDECVEMVRIAKRVDATYLDFNPTGGFNEAILVNRSNCGRFARAQREIEAEAKKLGVNVGFLRPLDQGMTSRLVHLS